MLLKRYAIVYNDAGDHYDHVHNHTLVNYEISTAFTATVSIQQLYIFWQPGLIDIQLCVCYGI